MNQTLHICSTSSLNQTQILDLTSLIQLCHSQDHTDLSYPIEEEGLIHLLGYLPDGRLASCLTLISYDDTLAECCAFTHPNVRHRGFFSQLLQKAISQFPDTDLLFAVSETCPDTLETLKAIGAEKDSEEHIMELTFANFADQNKLHLPSDVTLHQTSASEFSLYKTDETLCGTAYAEPISETSVCLHHVEILPQFRNQGYGTAFLELLLPQLAKQGIAHILLQVAGDNAPAIALYKKTGFSITKTLSYYLY